MSVVAVIGNIELFVLAVLLLAFVVVYASTARWWEGAVGTNMMAFMFALLLVVGLAVIHVVFVRAGHIVMWFEWLRVGVFAFVPIVAAWRLWLLIRVQVWRSRRK